MRKKLLTLFFSVLVPTIYAIHSTDASTDDKVHIVQDSDHVSDRVADSDEDDSQEDQEELSTIEEDNAMPPSNYTSFAIECIALDYLHNPAASVYTNDSFPIKRFVIKNLMHCNFAFLYAIRLGHSRFALCPGVGFSELKYDFASKKQGDQKIFKTLKREDETHTACRDVDVATSLGDGIDLSRSAFRVSYIDFLLRLRFNSVLDEPKEGFHGWVGVKLAIRCGAETAIFYEEYRNSSASLVREGDFNLARIAFGMQAAVGYSRFGVTVGGNFTPLFVKDQGPASVKLIKPWSIGLYIDLL